MCANDKTFDPKVVQVIVTLFYGSLILPYISALNWYMNIFLSQNVLYERTFHPKVVLGHCDLISWFSDFAVYLDTQLVYFHTSFRL